MTFIPTNTAEISTTNSTSSTLSANGVFTGTSKDVLAYGSICVTLYSDVSSALNGLSIEFSSDGSNWDIKYLRNITGGVSYSESYPIINKYFRAIYINGSTSQSQFRLQSLLLPHESFVTKEKVDNVSKNLVYTCNVVKHNDGNYRVPVTYYDSMSVNINNPITAFGELCIAEQTPMIELTFPYNINTDIVTTSITGSGNISNLNRKAKISSGTTSDSLARLKSRTILRYSTGVGMCFRASAIFSNPISTGKQYIGIGDSENGFYFGYTGTTFGIMRRSNSVDYVINKSTWNRDKLDGSGSSGYTLDPTKGNVYQILYQWLGFGCIKCFIEEPSLGLILVHQIEYAGTSTVVSIDNPSLPLSVEASNGSTSGDVSVETASMTGMLQGHIIDTIGINNSIGNVKSINVNEETNILSIRNKSTFNNCTNKTTLKIQLFDIATEGNKVVTFKVYLNGTINNSSFVNINESNSIVEYDFMGNTITNGRLIYTFYMKNSDSQHFDVSHYMPYVNPGESVTITATTNNKTNENSVAISWIERF